MEILGEGSQRGPFGATWRFRSRRFTRQHGARVCNYGRLGVGGGRGEAASSGARLGVARRFIASPRHLITSPRGRFASNKPSSGTTARSPSARYMIRWPTLRFCGQCL